MLRNVSFILGGYGCNFFSMDLLGGNAQNLSQERGMYIDFMMQVRLMRSISIIPT